TQIHRRLGYVTRGRCVLLPFRNPCRLRVGEFREKTTPRKPTPRRSETTGQGDGSNPAFLESQRCESETRLSRRLTRRASAEPLRFGIVSALKSDPVHVLDASRPTALACMEQT